MISRALTASSLLKQSFVLVIVAATSAIGLGRSANAAEDSALTVAEYVEKGVPAITAPWSGQDLNKAYAVLRGIADWNPKQLPSLDSAKSAALFRKLTDPAAFDALKDKSRPSEERLKEAVEHLNGLGGLGKMYLDESTHFSRFMPETAALMTHMLRLAAIIFDVVEAAKSETPATDPKAANFQEAYERMRIGFAQVVLADLAVLGDSKTWPLPVRKSVAEALQTHLPRIGPRLRPEMRTALRRAIDQVVEQTPDADFKKTVRELKSLIPADPDAKPAGAATPATPVPPTKPTSGATGAKPKK
jgi:hypothetical protein